MRSRLLALGVLLAAAVLLKADDPEATKADLVRLRGIWTAKRHMQDGKYRAPFDGELLVLGDDTFAFRFGDKVMKSGRIRVDADKRPRRMDLMVTDAPGAPGLKGKTQLGIYYVKDGKLEVCFAEPGGKRPQDLASRKGEKHTYSLYLYTRVKDD
jgi:uncharacterized protein (TIGR03067 family)